MGGGGDGFRPKQKVLVPGWGEFVMLSCFLAFCNKVEAQVSQKECEPQVGGSCQLKSQNVKVLFKHVQYCFYMQKGLISFFRREGSSSMPFWEI